MKNHARSPQVRSVLRLLAKAYQENNPQADPGRRQFIGNVAKAALAAALLPVMGCQTFGKKSRIAIVGGGMAGLRCAYILKKAGVSSTVFEADQRTGGRIFSVQNAFGDNTWTEFGGEFLDSSHKDMFDLVEEFGLKTLDTYQDTAERDIFFFENRKISEQEVLEAFKQMLPALESDRQACGETMDTERALALDRMPMQDYLNNLPGPDWMKELLSVAYKAEYGLDCEEQSTLNFLDMIGLDTEDGFLIFGDSDERYKVIGGNQQLTEKLAGQLGDQVKKQHELIRLEQAGAVYTLTFANGHAEEADYVVLAIPFTALRKIEMKVDDLSAEKEACIRELGYGQNNKVMLGTKQRIWRTGSHPHAGFVFHPVLQNTWDNTQMQNGNEGVGGFTVFMGGTPSIQLAAAAAEANLKHAVPDEVLQPILKEIDGVFPGFTQNWTGIHKAALWSNHPYIGASYGCYKVGQWQKLAGLEIEPIGNIFFAGEHCSNDHFGYMNGAAETGRLAADSILQKLTE
jgi:monoamine oxidase